MVKINFFVITIFLFLIFNSATLFASTCIDDVNNDLNEARFEDVTLVWFSRSSAKTQTHFELEVKDILWSGDKIYRPGPSLEAAKRLAKLKNNATLFFKIKATQEEIEALDSFLQKLEGFYQSGQNCISGANRALCEAGILNIPFPFNKVPVLAVSYLALQSRLGSSRIYAIERISGPKLSSYLTRQSIAELTGVGLTSALTFGALFIAVEMADGRLQALFVPLETSSR